METRINQIKNLKTSWMRKKAIINSKLSGFSGIWDRKKDYEIFKEFVFCLFTPQSNAKFCWKAVEGLSKKDILLKGSAHDISKHLNAVRFKNNKAKYLVKSRNLFYKNGVFSIIKILSSLSINSDKRKWLVNNVKGMGYKEAGHFLRNIGLGRDLAILDRHILKNLKALEVINGIPKSLTKKEYYEIEGKMKFFSKSVRIPLSHMDLLLWSNETGEIFK